MLNTFFSVREEFEEQALVNTLFFVREKFEEKDHVPPLGIAMMNVIMWVP